MTRVEILAAVRGLKAGDAIVINDWERPMKVCAVSDRYALAYNENDEYTIISKEPVEHQYNGISPELSFALLIGGRSDIRTGIASTTRHGWRTICDPWKAAKRKRQCATGRKYAH